MELWLIRHGETQYNREKRHQGQLDVPLSSLGIQQAQKLAARIGKLEFAAVYASDLSRALETAKIVMPDQPIKTDVRWREIDVGDRAGRLYSEVSSHKPKDSRDVHHRFPGGESLAEVMARVLAAIDDLHSQFSGSRVVIFTHGGTIRAALHGLLGDMEQRINFAERGNTSISKLEVQVGLRGRLLVYNDTAHLEE